MHTAAGSMQSMREGTCESAAYVTCVPYVEHRGAGQAGSAGTCVDSCAHVRVHVHTTGTYTSISSNHVIGCRAFHEALKMPVFDKHCKLKRHI